MRGSSCDRKLGYRTHTHSSAPSSFVPYIDMLPHVLHTAQAPHDVLLSEPHYVACVGRICSNVSHISKKRSPVRPSVRVVVCSCGFTAARRVWTCGLPAWRQSIAVKKHTYICMAYTAKNIRPHDQKNSHASRVNTALLRNQFRVPSENFPVF